jgi:hypothetical protein
VISGDHTKREIMTDEKAASSGRTLLSDKMRHHLTSLHESLWDIVEFGVQVP